MIHQLLVLIIFFFWVGRNRVCSFFFCFKTNTNDPIGFLFFFFVSITANQVDEVANSVTGFTTGFFIFFQRPNRTSSLETCYLSVRLLVISQQNNLVEWRIRRPMKSVTGFPTGFLPGSIRSISSSNDPTSFSESLSLNRSFYCYLFSFLFFFLRIERPIRSFQRREPSIRPTASVTGFLRV